MEVSEVWRVYYTSDETDDDSDKSWTVRAHEEWQILWIWVEYTANAGGGVRQLEVRVQDSAGDLIGILGVPSITQAGGTGPYNYLFAPAVADLLALRDSNYITTPIPTTTILDETQVLRIWDNNAVDATHDDMIVHIQFAARSVLQ